MSKQRKARNGTPFTESNDERMVAALRKYNARFAPLMYNKATAGKSVRYANWLIDAALVTCGCPYTPVRWVRFSAAARAFLALFV